MANQFRDLCYVRIATSDLQKSADYAADILGLQLFEKNDETAFFRSDDRAYSVCYSTSSNDNAIAFTLATSDELYALSEMVEANGISVTQLTDADCVMRKIKSGWSCVAPNGIVVEFIWRPLTSGWRYHGPRDAGITEFQGVSLCCSDIAANEKFWTEVIGLTVSDWAGDACYLRFDDEAHHRLALYPSKKDGLFGVGFAVEGINNVMQNFYFFEGRQLPVIHGPGKQTASGMMFVTTSGPDGILYTFGAGMAAGENRVPRQFPANPHTHCEWGSTTHQTEFLGER
ncbi:MAG: VOC family protein [Rhizobiaceae bacterium]